MRQKESNKILHRILSRIHPEAISTFHMRQKKRNNIICHILSRIQSISLNISIHIHEFALMINGERKHTIVVHILTRIN